MHTETDKDIDKDYELLQIMSRWKEKPMACEARIAEVMDKRTREKEAREEGRQQAIQEGKRRETRRIAKGLIGLLEDEMIADITGLTIEEIRAL